MEASGIKKGLISLLLLLIICGCSKEEVNIVELEEIDVFNISNYMISDEAAIFGRNNANVYNNVIYKSSNHPKVLLYDKEQDINQEYDLIIQIKEKYEQVILKASTGEITLSVDWDAYSYKKKKLLQSEEFAKQSSVIGAVYDMLLNLEKDNQTVSENNESQADSDNGTPSSFTYLDRLSGAKKQKFEQYLHNQDSKQLIGFTPEEMILVYLHLIASGNRYNLYDIVYDDGTLPNETDFVKDYDKYLSKQDSQMIMKYRYYDSINLSKENSTENYAVVLIKVSIGVHSESTALSLKTQDGIWKIELLHLIEMLKKQDA
ncbi:hypothetical protein [Bacillus salitolerans]